MFVESSGWNSITRTRFPLLNTNHFAIIIRLWKIIEKYFLFFYPPNRVQLIYHRGTSPKRLHR